MKILSIETSCDETGISILEQSGSRIVLRGNALASQIELHAQYGGVFPAMAKRAHAEKFTTLLQEALTQAALLHPQQTELNTAQLKALDILTEREHVMKDALTVFFASHKKPDIGYIAVTVGPGLEPALWVGVNAARVISLVWDIPIIPINHMEGHIVASALQQVESQKLKVERESQKSYRFQDLAFPILALLVSGGHTELVVAEAFGQYKKIGATRDDAVGEAFDKVARMLGLPYPGGPAISRLALEARTKNLEPRFTLPRPMLHSQDYDFSFSGIKTAALYAIRDLTAQTGHEQLTDDDKGALAAAFEDAVVEVLIHKTLKAAAEYNIQTIVVGGGVASNTYLRNELTAKTKKQAPYTTVLFPEPWLATDNAVMIGMAAMAQVIAGQIKTASSEELKADGNLSL